MRDGRGERESDDAGENEVVEEWLRAASSNPSFAFLDDPEEDVYGPEDGAPSGEQEDRG